MQVSEKIFGKGKEGQTASLIELNNGFMSVKLSTYAACITSIIMPDKNGSNSELVLGFNDLDSYLKEHPYFGVIIGPVANRISGAEFEIDNTVYKLEKNEGDNHLHGGSYAFDKQFWAHECFKTDESVGVIMTYTRVDGESAYPGNLKVSVQFSLDKNNNLELLYSAESDHSTPVNLTHHEYFNLKDGGASDMLDHKLWISAEHYTSTQDDKCVDGELVNLDSTPFNFNPNKTIQQGLKELHGQLGSGFDFDHNYVIKNEDGFGLVAWLQEDTTGRRLDIYSDQPCLQLYTASHLDGSLGRNTQIRYNAYAGICLESQEYPDAPNQNHFPSILIGGDKKYIRKTRYSFSLI